MELTVTEKHVLSRLGQILHESSRKHPWFYHKLLICLSDKKIKIDEIIPLNDFAVKFKEICKSLKMNPMEYQSLILQIKSSNKEYNLLNCKPVEKF